MGKALKYLVRQMPGFILATAFVLMFGISPQDLLVALLKPVVASPPEWLFSWQFRAAASAFAVTVLCWRVTVLLQSSSVSLRFDRLPYYFHTSGGPHQHRYAHTLMIENTGAEDLEKRMVVKVLNAWNGDAMILVRLPFSSRTEKQIREGRNEPFTLRVGEPKRIVLGFSPDLEEPVHVEFVDGLELHPLPFDDEANPWTMIRVGAFGARLPTYVTAIFTLRDGKLNFRRASLFERLFCSCTVTIFRVKSMHGARKAARVLGRARSAAYTMWQTYWAPLWGSFLKMLPKNIKR